MFKNIFRYISNSFLSLCFGCELYSFSRLLFITNRIGCNLPIIGCYYCVPYEICCKGSGSSGFSFGGSRSDGGGGGGGSNSGGGGNKNWNYKPNYAYQNPSGRDAYGNVTYTRYNTNYAFENPTGRDAYGNPAYG